MVIANKRELRHTYESQCSEEEMEESDHWMLYSPWVTNRSKVITWDGGVTWSFHHEQGMYVLVVTVLRIHLHFIIINDYLNAQ